jgi:hypothetical protein
VYKVLVGKRPLERPRRRWEDGIRMGLGEMGFDWLRVAGCECMMNFRVLAPRSCYMAAKYVRDVTRAYVANI